MILAIIYGSGIILALVQGYLLKKYADEDALEMLGIPLIAITVLLPPVGLVISLVALIVLGVLWVVK